MPNSRVLKTIPLAVLLGFALLPVARAAASASQVTVVQDDSQLVATSPSHRAALLDEMKSLGVDVVKVRIDWRRVAPSPGGKKKPPGFSGEDSTQYPSGVWTNYDDLLRAIVARGMRPFVMLGGRAPHWASDESGKERPNAAEFARFVQAVGSRYSGTFAGPFDNPSDPLPRVDIWSPWNEANLADWIVPQYSHGKPVSPRIYRRLVYAAHDGLASSGHGGDELLIGELVPFVRSGESDRKISPIAFLRELACVDGDYHAFTGTSAKKHGCDGFTRLPGTGLAYHPYTLAGGPDVADPNGDDASIGELGRVVRALDRIGQAHRLQNTRMPVWITEFGFQTDPPDRYQSPLRKVPGFMGESEWLAYRNPRVASYAQYPFVDDPVGKGGGGFQSGIRTSDGKRKHGVYREFRLPLFVQRRSDKVVEVFGGVRAGTTGDTVTIESRIGSGGKFQKLSGGTVQLNAQGYFDRIFQLSHAMDRTYHFRFAGDTSRNAGVHR